MRKLRFHILAAIVWSFAVMSASAQTFEVITNFNRSHGSNPATALIQGTDGKLYSTTPYGGQNRSIDTGAVYAVTTDGTLTTVYSFCIQTNCDDGVEPEAKLVLAGDGNYYGTTEYGGKGCPTLGGCGTIFRITSTGKLTTLYNFCVSTNCPDGSYPLAGLIQGTDGSLYGVTSNGGIGPCSTAQATGCGTIFKITTSGTFTVLHQFNSSDGGIPEAELMQATDGNFYGTTTTGGTSNLGTVFRMIPAGTLTSLHSFDGADGADPRAALIQATDGSLYGTTTEMGTNHGGTAFRISHSGKFTTFYNFCSQPDCTDGRSPSGLIQATDGNFYGTTVSGGTGVNCPDGETGCGTAFRVTSAGVLTNLHSFEFRDGISPIAGLLQATDGNFYGTTELEGGDLGCSLDAGCGTAYRLSLGIAPFVSLQHYSGKVGQQVGVFG